VVALLSKNKGFILVELMISLLIVSVIVITSFSVFDVNARTISIINQKKNEIQNEIELDLRSFYGCLSKSEVEDAEC